MNQNRNDYRASQSEPQFTQSEMSDLYDPNMPQIRNRHIGQVKFQHTESRKRFTAYLSAYKFVIDNKIVDARIEPIYENVREWEVIWRNDGGIV